MTVTLGWGLALALAILVGLSVVASRLAGLHLERPVVVAAVRAIAQLTAVSLVITAAVGSLPTALAFTALMLVVAVWTTTRRVGAPRAWPWTTLAMLSGALPVLLVIFATGAAPLNGVTVVSLGGIVIGNMMTVHTLLGRRVFAELRAQFPAYEGGRALGMTRAQAVGEVVRPVLAEALIPNLDQTRTVGLVTLPGAFIGVLLGGGSPVQAGAAQVLVLLGIMAGQLLTVAVAAGFVRAGRLLPDDLAERLRR